jgi:hypothetical protein
MASVCIVPDTFPKLQILCGLIVVTLRELGAFNLDDHARNNANS